MKDVNFYADHINKLQLMLVSENDFSETYRYFFDYLGDDIDFIKLGKRDKSPDLKKILQTIGESIFEEKVTVTGFLVTQIPKYRFYHGGCQLNGHMAVFFFFRNFSMGMAGVSNADGPYNTLLARFTVFEAPNKRLSLLSFSGPTLH